MFPCLAPPPPFFRDVQAALLNKKNRCKNTSAGDIDLQTPVLETMKKSIPAAAALIVAVAVKTLACL